MKICLVPEGGIDPSGTRSTEAPSKGDDTRWSAPDGVSATALMQQANRAGRRMPDRYFLGKQCVEITTARMGRRQQTRHGSTFDNDHRRRLHEIDIVKPGTAYQPHDAQLRISDPERTGGAMRVHEFKARPAFPPYGTQHCRNRAGHERPIGRSEFGLCPRYGTIPGKRSGLGKPEAEISHHLKHEAFRRTEFAVRDKKRGTACAGDLGMLGWFGIHGCGPGWSIGRWVCPEFYRASQHYMTIFVKI